MKKTILTLAVLVGFGLTQVNAQSFGIKAEANMSNFILSDIDNLSSNMGFGASLGGFMKLGLSEHFAIQPELLFHFKNSEMENKRANDESDYQYWGAEIPVYIMGQTSLGNGLGYLGLGPYVGFGFDAQSKPSSGSDFDLYEKDAITDEAAMHRWDFGFGAMLGYEFKCGLQINAGYKIGVINELNADNGKMFNQAVSLGIGFRF